MRIIKSGEWSGRELREKGVVDTHYGALAQRALHDSPASLELEEDTKKKFESTFGMSWPDALASGKLVNLTEALKQLPTLNESTMASAWRSGPSVKLMPGTYVAKVEDLFIINGFYADMSSMWKQDSAKVLFYLVQWNEADLSWADFRGKLIGSTDPAKADPVSIRGTLLKDYQSRFGLDTTPTTTLNGVHASAGPIEGARECVIWSKMPASHVFVLHKAARKAKVSEAAWKQAMDNAKVSLGDKKGLVFDISEGMSAVQGLELLKELAQVPKL
jgi:hypothetical protein